MSHDDTDPNTEIKPAHPTDLPDSIPTEPADPATARGCVWRGWGPAAPAPGPLILREGAGRVPRYRPQREPWCAALCAEHSQVRLELSTKDYGPGLYWPIELD